MTVPANIYLFGDSWGESTLIHVPGEYAAVIDCFDYSKKSELRKTIESLNISSLDLLVVTHPHLDHFEDIYSLASELNPKKVCSYGYSDLRTLLGYYEVILQQIQSAKKRGRFRNKSKILKKFAKAPDQYRKLAAFLQDSAKVRGVNHFVTSGYSLIDTRATLGLTLSSVTPIGKSPQLIEQELKNFVTATAASGSRRNAIRDRDSDDNDIINSACVSILIEYKNAKMLFCADANSDSLERLVSFSSEVSNPNVLADLSLIKVSHHGSHADNPDSFWKMVAVASPKVVPICTYYGAKLPDKRAFERIKIHTGSIVSQPLGSKSAEKRCARDIGMLRVVGGHPLSCVVDPSGSVTVS